MTNLKHVLNKMNPIEMRNVKEYFRLFQSFNRYIVFKINEIFVQYYNTLIWLLLNSFMI